MTPQCIGHALEIRKVAARLHATRSAPASPPSGRPSFNAPLHPAIRFENEPVSNGIPIRHVTGIGAIAARTGSREATMAGSAMAGGYVTVTAGDGGKFKAYVAKPAKGSGPGLVLCQEIFGVNQHIRDLA